MPTELEELVEFLHHGNVTVRGTAAEHLVGYSQAQPTIFKAHDMTPVKDLKLLIRDHPPIAKNALTMLINLSAEPAILEYLASDDEFITSILTRIMDPKLTTVTELTMLLANLCKHSNLSKVLTLKLPSRTSLGTKSDLAFDQLLSAFLRGQDNQYNTSCNYDYLAYALAELARHPAVRTFLATPRPDAADDEDRLMPLTKLLVFTQHKSVIRRRGTAAAIKNVCFEVSAHAALVSADDERGANVLPYVLLPLMGSESYPEEESDAMPVELQLLEPDKEREREADIMVTLLETLLLLTTSRVGREEMRRVQVYPVVRECHLNVEDEDVRSVCDRLVQVLMRDEAPEGQEEGAKVTELPEDDEDEDMQITDV